MYTQKEPQCSELKNDQDKMMQPVQVKHVVVKLFTPFYPEMFCSIKPTDFKIVKIITKNKYGNGDECQIRLWEFQIYLNYSIPNCCQNISRPISFRFSTPHYLFSCEQ